MLEIQDALKTLRQAPNFELFRAEIRADLRTHEKTFSLPARVFSTDADFLVFEALFFNKHGLIRSEICQITNLGRTTVFDALRRLELKQLAKFEDSGNGIGRPIRIWKLRK